MKQKFLASSPSEIDLKACRALGMLHDLCDDLFIHMFKKQTKLPPPDLLRIKWM